MCDYLLATRTINPGAVSSNPGLTIYSFRRLIYMSFVSHQWVKLSLLDGNQMPGNDSVWMCLFVYLFEWMNAWEIQLDPIRIFCRLCSTIKCLVLVLRRSEFITIRWDVLHILHNRFFNYFWIAKEKRKLILYYIQEQRLYLCSCIFPFKLT